MPRARIGPGPVRRSYRSPLPSCLPRAGARADERILAWQSDIRVRPDSTLEVRETLRVRAEGVGIRRGIFRDFPTVYTNSRGERVVTGFDVQGVTRDGRAEPYRVEKRSNGVRVWIGDAAVELAPRRVHLHHRLHERPPARVLRGSRRALLERHRQRLGVPDRRGRRRRWCCPPKCPRRRSASRRTPGRRARRAANGPRASTPASPPTAPRADSGRAKDSPSSRAGPRVTSRRRARRAAPATCSAMRGRRCSRPPGSGC